MKFVKGDKAKIIKPDDYQGVVADDVIGEIVTIETTYKESPMYRDGEYCVRYNDDYYGWACDATLKRID